MSDDVPRDARCGGFGLVGVKVGSGELKVKEEELSKGEKASSSWKVKDRLSL